MTPRNTEQFLALSYYCGTAVPLPFPLPNRIFDVKPAVTDWLSTAYRSLAGTIHPRAEIDGPVIVEPGATVDAGAVITGPALICRDAYIGRGLVRDHTVIGPGSHIGYACEITRSLVLADTRAMHFVFIGDSIIGNRVNVGSSSVLANLRVDRPVVEPAVDELAITIADVRVGTGQTKFGSVLGDRVQLPALTSVAPGTLIGPDVTIYPTDLQPQLVALLTQAPGTSRVLERVYTRRDTHIPGLLALGADIRGRGQELAITGPCRLRGATVRGDDIRAATALVLAALAAEGTTIFHGLPHLKRGYEDLVATLGALGADITEEEH